MSDADFDFEAEQAIQLERIQEEEAARAAEARGEEQEPDWLEGVDEAATEAQNRPRRNVGRVRPEYGESSDEDDVQVAFADRSRQAGASPAPAPAGPPRPSQFLPRPPTPGGGGGGGANDARSTASTTAQRLHQTLEHVPGWAPQIMGAGIAPKAPSFTTGQTGYWVPYNEHGAVPARRQVPAGARDRPGLRGRVAAGVGRGARVGHDGADGPGGARAHGGHVRAHGAAQRRHGQGVRGVAQPLGAGNQAQEEGPGGVFQGGEAA